MRSLIHIFFRSTFFSSFKKGGGSQFSCVYAQSKYKASKIVEAEHKIYR